MIEFLEKINTILFSILAVLGFCMAVVIWVMTICEAISRWRHRREKRIIFETILRDELVAQVKSEYLRQVKAVSSELYDSRDKIEELWKRFDLLDERVSRSLPELKRKIQRVERRLKSEQEFGDYLEDWNRTRLIAARKRRR